MTDDLTSIEVIRANNLKGIPYLLHGLVVPAVDAVALVGVPQALVLRFQQVLGVSAPETAAEA